MQVKIDGKEVNCEKNKTILQVLEGNGIKVPKLCNHPDLKAEGRCRLCIVQVNGKLMTSCNENIADGMEIITNSEEVLTARRINAELVSSHHIQKTDKELDRHEMHEIIEDLGLTESRFNALTRFTVDDTNPSVVIDHNKCVLCGRCIQACQQIQSVFAIEYINRGIFTKISPIFELPLGEIACTFCGQCSLYCPVNAIQEKDDTSVVMKAIKDPNKHVVAQIAPSIRASIGEEFGIEPGTLVTGKIVTALRKLGFDRVFDTNFGADLTIVEEANEFVQRFLNNDNLPQITSCSPGWVKFIEHFYPELLPHLSSCKSPHMMFGAIAKTYYPKKFNINAKDLFVVSIMPCTAKKFEAKRPEMKSSGYRDVDAVLTTRETARLLKQNNIDLKNLPDEDFDHPLGESTGAGAMFGATGGVMEAALRTAYDVATGNQVEKFEFDQIRGLDRIKEGTMEIKGKKIRFAVAHGLINARALLEEIKKDRKKYQFIEIMACPGGCIGGGGQPKPTYEANRLKRVHAIYEEDKNKPIRESHKNPEIIQLYKEFLGKPLGKKSHHLLHTSYTKRSRF